MNTKLIHTNYWEHSSIKYRFDIYSSDSFDELSNVTQVYAIMTNKERTKIMMVQNIEDLWLLPGGTVEKGETLIETLVREIHEETNCDVDLNLTKPFFYQEALKFDSENNKWISMGYQVRYLTVIKEFREFVSDPDHGKTVRAEWVDFNEVAEKLKWGDTGLLIQNKLLYNIDL